MATILGGYTDMVHLKYKKNVKKLSHWGMKNERPPLSTALTYSPHLLTLYQSCNNCVLLFTTNNLMHRLTYDNQYHSLTNNFTLSHNKKDTTLSQA